MSKQFQLFILPSDALSLVEELRDRFDARVLDEHAPTKVPHVLKSPVRNKSIFSASESTSIRCYLAPPNAHIVSTHIKELNLWSIRTSSEVVELSGCDFDGKTLLVGRMYFQTDDVVNGMIVKKRAEFLKWADRVFGYTKKSLQRDPKLGPIGAYVGKDAMTFRNAGGKFAESIKDAGVPITPAQPTTIRGLDWKKSANRLK